MAECYKNKFHPTKPQCKKEAVWVNTNIPKWTWCEEHKTGDPEQRKLIVKEP